ncbi:hypothetical protein KH017_20350, partial [bacterium]|nr:hypothetical protein [bacterium]
MRITAEKDGFRIENGGGVPLIAELRLTAGFNGRKVEAKNWRSCGPDRFEAENGGIRFRAGVSPDDGGLFLKSEFTNETGSPVEVDFLRWSRSPERDSLAVPGPRLRVYREGWTMASACGTVGWGETDFRCNPDYLPFAVSVPERFEPPKPN